MIFNMRTKAILLITAISLVTNGVLGYKIFSTQDTQKSLQEQYPYLSKRIFANNPNDIVINFIPLRQAFKEYVEKQDGQVGAYFEYLPSGTSIGVNDKEEIKLVSLSKVPLVMSIFKKIEKGKMSLSDILTVKKEHLDERFGNLWKKGEGTKLSVEELIKLALVESDNTAYNVLFDQLTPQEVNGVYEGLDIQISKEGEHMLVSPKSYSSILRSLYLSSFLSEENSNRILEILTKTAFNDKISAGVPENIKVAHKIGVFEKLAGSQNVFIDCGIIYVPNRPYILCAFVHGTNEQAQKYMSYISKMVYEYIIRVKGGQ